MATVPSRMWGKDPTNSGTLTVCSQLQERGLHHQGRRCAYHKRSGCHGGGTKQECPFNWPMKGHRKPLQYLHGECFPSLIPETKAEECSRAETSDVRQTFFSLGVQTFGLIGVEKKQLVAPARSASKGLSKC